MSPRLSKQSRNKFIKDLNRKVMGWRKVIRIEEYEPMAGSREDAIRWLIQAEGLDQEYDAGYICYNLGLPYSMEKIFAPIIAKN